MPEPSREKSQLPLQFKLTQNQQEDMKRKIDISFFVVKEELSLSKHERIIALEKRHGVSHGLVYSNRPTALSSFHTYIYSQ